MESCETCYYSTACGYAEQFPQYTKPLLCNMPVTLPEKVWPNVWPIVESDFWCRNYKAKPNDMVVKLLHWNTEFLSISVYGIHPWLVGALNAGTCMMVGTTSSNHPGIVQFRSHISNLNSGYGLWTNLSVIILAGSETSELIFKLRVLHENTRIRFGFQNSTTQTPPIDGVYLNIIVNVLSGITRNNNIESQTETFYALVDDTWYHAKIALSSDASKVDFFLYAENGDLLWTDSLEANIPTTRNTGHCILAYSTNPEGTVKNLIDADYMDFAINRTLTR